MKQIELKCPLCYEIIYSGIGRGCKMCGMVLENPKKEFCSEECRIKYVMINKLKKKIVMR